MKITMWSVSIHMLEVPRFGTGWAYVFLFQSRWALSVSFHYSRIKCHVTSTFYFRFLQSDLDTPIQLLISNNNNKRKVSPTPKYYFKLKYTKGLKIGLEAPRIKWIVILNKSWNPRANQADEIFIRAWFQEFSRMLIKVNLRPIFKAKILVTKVIKIIM